MRRRMLIMEHSEIFLNSIMGITSPRTLKLLGEVKGKEVMVMIDPKATHNFISMDAVEKLGIPVSSTKSFGVSLGMGEAVQGAGRVQGSGCELANSDGGERFPSLQLGNSDLILGVQ